MVINHLEVLLMESSFSFSFKTSNISVKIVTEQRKSVKKSQQYFLKIFARNLEGENLPQNF